MTKRTGFAVDLLSLILERALSLDPDDPSFTVVINPDSAGGFQTKNGTWTGAIGGLIDDKWDIVLPVLTMNDVRSKFVDFIQPVVIYVPQMFLVHVIPEHDVSVSLTKPYQLAVWLFWCLFLFLTTLFLRQRYTEHSLPLATERVGYELLFQKRDNGDQMWTWSTRATVLISTWSMAVFFGTAFYRAFFVQQLTPKHRHRPPFRDSIDLARLMRAGQYRFLSSENSWRTSKLLRWDVAYGWDEMRRAALYNPESYELFSTEHAAYEHLMQNPGSVISADSQMVNWLMRWPQSRTVRLIR